MSKKERRFGKATLVHADCFDWLDQQAENSLHAVVTDPPYGLHEYSREQQAKLRQGRGGVWRIPPSFDGHVRSPLPRFTTLTPELQVRAPSMAEVFRYVESGVDSCGPCWYPDGRPLSPILGGYRDVS